jgi:hypothetical protein
VPGNGLRHQIYEAARFEPRTAGFPPPVVGFPYIWSVYDDTHMAKLQR